MNRCAAALLLAVGVWAGFSAGQGAGAAGIADAWEGTYWGEPSSALVAHFGTRATALHAPIDFGDSYAQIVLRRVMVGEVPLVAFFQMDKATRGLRRIQLERQRHGVNPPAFRAVLGALEAAYGPPDEMCGLAPGATGFYQAAAECFWRRDGAVIRAIYRDTTIEAFEGCLSGDPSADFRGDFRGDFGMAGPCGLTGQLLVRISPPGADAAGCPMPARAR